MDRKRERKKRERARQVGAAVLQQPRGRSDLIGCGSDSLNSSTTFQRARARGRARASTRQDTDVSRGKGAFARLLSSLPHYSIMMACGVCRTPFALIAPAPSPLLAHTSSPPRHTLSFPLLPNSYSYSFLPLLSIFSSIFPPLSTKRERERRLRPSRCIRVPPRRRRMSSLVPRFQARARVHIAVTMMCVILRRLANVNPRRCDEEGEQARREREESEVKRGGGGGGGTGGRESSRREGTKVDGRRDKVGQRLSNGSEQVPGPLLTSPRPKVGGERVTVRAPATEDTWFSVKRGSPPSAATSDKREGRGEVHTHTRTRAHASRERERKRGGEKDF